MSLFRPAREQRATPAPDVPLTRKLGSALESTTMTEALRLAPVYAAVSLLVDSLIPLPLHVYRDKPGGVRERIPDPPVIADPAAWVDPLTWRAQYVSSLLLRGNAYGLAVQTSATGLPTKIHWVHPDKMQVDTSDGRPVYSLDGKVVDRHLVTHVRLTTLPGDVVGLSPIALFRQQIEGARAASELQAQTYKSGAPAAHFKNTDQTLTADQSQTVKERFRAQMHQGGVLVTGSDWDYKVLGLTPADAQFVESAKLTATQIAAIYHVPPEEIGGEAGSSLTYSTLEMNDLRFARRALLPLTVRLERALTDCLPRPQYVRFNLDAFVRTDLRTRMAAHEIALRTGLETQAEGRALEERPPLTDGEIAFWAEHYLKIPPTPTITTTAQEGENA